MRSLKILKPMILGFSCLAMLSIGPTANADELHNFYALTCVPEKDYFRIETYDVYNDPSGKLEEQSSLDSNPYKKRSVIHNSLDGKDNVECAIRDKTIKINLKSVTPARSGYCAGATITGYGVEVDGVPVTSFGLGSACGPWYFHLITGGNNSLTHCTAKYEEPGKAPQTDDFKDCQTISFNAEKNKKTEFRSRVTRLLKADGEALNGPSFRCSSSIDHIDKEICSEPSLAKTDQKIADLYFRVKQRLSEKDHRELERLQLNYLKGLRSRCLQRSGLPKSKNQDEFRICIRSRMLYTLRNLEADIALERLSLPNTNSIGPYHLVYSANDQVCFGVQNWITDIVRYADSGESIRSHNYEVVPAPKNLEILNHWKRVKQKSLTTEGLRQRIDVNNDGINEDVKINIFTNKYSMKIDGVFFVELNNGNTKKIKPWNIQLRHHPFFAKKPGGYGYYFINDEDGRKYLTLLQSMDRDVSYSFFRSASQTYVAAFKVSYKMVVHKQIYIFSINPDWSFTDQCYFEIPELAYKFKGKDK